MRLYWVEVNLSITPIIFAAWDIASFTCGKLFLANNLPHVPDYEQYLTSITSLPLVFNPPSLIEIESILSNIKETTVGYDKLPMFIFKDNFMASREVLLSLFKLSLQMAEVPDAMKIAKVSCIFKSGDPTSISTYRPISILPSLRKALEKHSLRTCNGRVKFGKMVKEFGRE